LPLSNGNRSDLEIKSSLRKIPPQLTSEHWKKGELDRDGIWNGIKWGMNLSENIEADRGNSESENFITLEYL